MDNKRLDEKYRELQRQREAERQEQKRQAEQERAIQEALERQRQRKYRDN